LSSFPLPRSLGEVRDQIREMGQIAGHPERAAAEIARLDAAIAGARQAAANRHFRVLPLSRRGWVPGRDSFVGAVLAEAGLANAAGDLGVGFTGFASLEAIVNLKPDFLVVSDAGDRAEDDGRAFLLPPRAGALLSASETHRHSERMTECGGVLLADALNTLTEELKRVAQ